MSSINIPPSLLTLLAGGALPSAALAPVLNPPPGLAAVPPGTVLDATVLGRSAATGIITVQTAQGTFGFASALAVPPGTALSLTVQGTPGQPQVTATVVAPAASQAPPVPQAPTAPLVSGAVVEAVLASATPPALPPIAVPPPPATPPATAAASEIAGTTLPPAVAANQVAPPPAVAAVTVPTAVQPTIGAAAVTAAATNTGPPATPDPTQQASTGSLPAGSPPSAAGGAPTQPNPFTSSSLAPSAFTPVGTAALPIASSAAVVAALIGQELAASSAAATAAPAAAATAAAAAATTIAATTTATGAASAAGTAPTPTALVGLPAGERLLLRVISVAPPATAEAIAAVDAEAASATPAVAPPPVAPGTVAATTTAAGAAVSAPVSAAAQVQATAATQIAGRPAQPTVAQEIVAALPTQAASASGLVAPGAVQPLLRGDASGAFAAELPPEAASSAVAVQGAIAAEIGTQTAAQSAAQAATTASAAAATPSPGTAITPGASQFTATVVGTAANGQPVLLAGQSLLTVRAAPLATGSQLVLQLAAAPAGGALASGVLDAALRSSLPSLPELATAAQLVGGPAQAALAAIVPQPGPALAGQMALFLSALQTGNLRAWIGDPARTALQRAGRGGVLGKVDDELKTASAALARSAAAGDWRSQGIPFSNGGAIVPIQLYVHQTKPDDEGDGKGQAGKAPTRFLLDLELTALGRIQLDGLAQPPRFDLILRTPQALPDTVRNDLRLLFTDVTSARGLTGSVAFQVAPPIVPTGATPQAARPGILV